jgi:hypothetical protein
MYCFLAWWALNAFDRVLNPKPDYTEYLGSLKILESRLNIAQTSNGPRVYVTGILTNTSALPWRGIELECRFFDNKGELIDAAHPRAGLTIQSHDDAAFRVSVEPGRSTNDYGPFRVSVSGARNTKGFY